ncbi:MAG: hypothetical protein JXD23_10810 [Spirochaetales bacterium]|nr:hypothetical protein [Spirochaetales bacterium]
MRTGKKKAAEKTGPVQPSRNVSRRRIAFAARGTGFTAAFDALRTIANIPSLGEIPEAKVVALGNAILGSGLSPSGYTAFSSVYRKGKLKNISAVEVTAIIIAALGQGKGLIRIEQELNRRGGQ